MHACVHHSQCIVLAKGIEVFSELVKGMSTSVRVTTCSLTENINRGINFSLHMLSLKKMKLKLNS